MYVQPSRIGERGERCTKNASRKATRVVSLILPCTDLDIADHFVSFVVQCLYRTAIFALKHLDPMDPDRRIRIDPDRNSELPVPFWRLYSRVGIQRRRPVGTDGRQ
jgi:hypothetical protein